MSIMDTCIAIRNLATQTTLAAVLARLDVALSTRASQATVVSILAQLDVALSTRASEATLVAINGKITACNTGAIGGSLTQSTKHDAATYKTALFYAAADGDIVAAVGGKKIKVHFLDVQAQGTVTVTIRDDNAGGARLDEWKLQDREGAVKQFVPYPASHYVTLQTAGKALFCDVSAAVTVKINVIYTDADAS